MKNYFTLLAALAVSAAASAQVEQGLIDPDALGLPTALSAGTELCSTENVTMSLAYDDDVKAGGINFNDCNALWVNGAAYTLTGGITGNSNPQGCSFETAPTSGFVLRLDVAKNGYIVIPSKLSSNKNYWVFEGLSGAGEMCEAYNFGIVWADAEGADVKPHYFSMPADEDGYIDLDAADASRFYNLETNITRQLRMIITNDPDTGLSGNGVGFLSFPVYADAGSYLFCAQGSKISVNGFIFVPADGDDPNVAKPECIAAGTDAEVLYTFYGESGGINDIISDAVLNENAPIYNVLGQPVSKDYKGIQIQNGKKFYNR